MRFATFAAFMLPLAALAAPTLSPLDSARQQFETSLKSTGDDIKMAIQQVADFHSDVTLVAVFQTVQLVATNVGFGAQAASRIRDALQNHHDVSPDDQLAVSLGTITSLDLLLDLQKFVNDGGFDEKITANFDIHALQSTIDSAVMHINDTVTAGIEILSLQGSSVQKLFDDAYVPVPPGFWN